MMWMTLIGKLTSLVYPEMSERTATQQSNFPGRLAIQQRVLPSYRTPFFSLLVKACDGGLSIFAGDPLPREGISSTKSSSIFNYFHARNRHFQDPSSSLYFCWQDGLLSWLDSVDPDGLIIEANPRYLSSGQAIEWMHKKGRPVIGWGLGAPVIDGISFPKNILSIVQKRFRRRFLLSLDGVISYSNSGAEEYITEGVPRERISIATNAVVARPTESPPARSKEIRGHLRVLFVGRLQARKRLGNLFLACANLPSDLQPLVWIIGDGPAGVHFQNYAKEVYHQVEFLGAQYGSALRSYYLEADLFVLPGSGGLAVQEAMAHGLPVIVAEGDGTQSDLVRKENGWLVPPDDVDALTQALAGALADVKSLRLKGLESLRIVKDEVNLESMVESFVFALNKITSHTTTRY